MQRVLVLGRGGSGKTTFARRLAEVSGLPFIELDSYRRRYLPLIRQQIASDAPDATLRVIRRPKEAESVLNGQRHRGR